MENELNNWKLTKLLLDYYIKTNRSQKNFENSENGDDNLHGKN
jgi:hypothetical protein